MEQNKTNLVEMFGKISFRKIYNLFLEQYKCYSSVILIQKASFIG